MTSSTPLSSASSSRLPTLKELDSKLNISGLRKYDDEIQAAARKNREEASKDLELQERVDKVRERLRATIAAKKAKDETEDTSLAAVINDEVGEPPGEPASTQDEIESTEGS